MTTRMLQRRDLASTWVAVNPILGDGEIGFEKDTGELKIGDGVTHWVDLRYPYIHSKIIDAKGDLIVGTADNTPTRLARGATGQQLTVQADGSLVWATPYAGADRVAKAGDTMTGQLNTNSNVRFTVNGGGTVYAMSSGADGYVAGSLTALRIRGGTSGVQFTNNADSIFNLTIDDSGNIAPLGNVTIPNTKSLFLGQTSGNQAYIQGNGTTLKIRGGTSGSKFRDNADTVDLFTISDTGVVDIHGSFAALALHGIDNDAQLLSLYVTGNALRVWNGTSDVWKVDNAGTVTPINNIIFPAGKGPLYGMSSGNQGYVIGSGAVLQLRGGLSGVVFRDNADTVTIFKVDNSGVLTLNNTVEIGRQDGVASTPFIDFHSGATLVDYDARILASGGTGVAGKGGLTITASSLYQVGADFMLDDGSNGRRVRLTSDATNTFFQSDKPVLFTAPFSGTPRLTIDLNGGVFPARGTALPESGVTALGVAVPGVSFRNDASAFSDTWLLHGKGVLAYGITRFPYDDGTGTGLGGNLAISGWAGLSLATGNTEVIRINGGDHNISSIFRHNFLGDMGANGNLIFNTNTKGVFFTGSSGNQPYITANSTNLLLRGGSSGLVVRDNSDISNLFVLDNSGNIFLNNNHGVNFAMTSGNGGYILSSDAGLVVRVGVTNGIIFRNNADSFTIGQLWNDGTLNLHGSNTQVVLYGRDNDAQSFASFVNGNVYHLWSSTAALDRLTLDSVGNAVFSGTINDSSGRVYSPGNPPPGGGTLTFHGARAYPSATVSIPTAGIVVPFDSENYDTDNFHSTSVNTSRFTIPAGMAGKYKISGLLEWSTVNGTGNRQAAIYKNGAAAAWGTITSGDATRTGACSVTTTLLLAAGDYIELFAYQNSGSNMNLQIIGAGVDTRFEIDYLGA